MAPQNEEPPASAREPYQQIPRRWSPQTVSDRERVESWIKHQNLRPAVCGMNPRRGSFDPPDVRLSTIVRVEFEGYNIEVVSLTGRGSEFLAPGPVRLDHILTAAGLMYPFHEWHPIEFYEAWAETRARRLEELRQHNPLEEPDEARRRAKLERAFEELRPPRRWFLLKGLIERGDAIVPVPGSASRSIGEVR